MNQAGGLALGRHPQREHRALAHGTQQPGGVAPSHPRHRWRRPSGAAGRRSRHGQVCGSRRWRGPACCTASTRETPGTPRPAVLRDVREPRHLPPGRSAVTKPRLRGSCSVAPCQAFDDDVWELRDGRGLGATPATGGRPRREAASSGSADRGHQVQRVAPRRPEHGKGGGRKCWTPTRSVGTPLSSPGGRVGERGQESRCASKTEPSRLCLAGWLTSLRSAPPSSRTWSRAFREPSAASRTGWPQVCWPASTPCTGSTPASSAPSAVGSLRAAS